MKSMQSDSTTPRTRQHVIVRRNQKTAMRCSTGRLILAALCVLIVIQFILQLKISYLDKVGSSLDLREGNGQSVGGIRLERIPLLIGKFAPRYGRSAISASSSPPRTPPPETLIRPWIPKTPRCDITVKEALSAISRAKTDECRRDLEQVACAHQNKQLYWKNFTRTCPVPDNPALKANMSKPNLHPDIPRVRILFMITVHGRAVRQVYRVLKSIYHVNHYYYIHVDARSHFMLKKMTELAKKYDNIRITPWRLATIWGGASLLQMLLHAMEDAVDIRDWYWDYFVNLSESDYPFKNFTYIVDYLTAWKKYNFLRAHGKTSPRFIHKQGLDQTFFECEHHMWRIGPRQLPTGIHIDGGSDWIMVNRDYVNYLMTSKDAVVLGLKHMFSYTLLPAESFFHTLLRNGPMCETMVRDNLRLANWKRSLGCRCQYKAIVDWCGCSPNDFVSEDFGRIKGSTDKLFGRKFEAVVNLDIINKVDFWLFGEYPKGTPSLTSYWENIYNADDFGESFSDTAMTLYRSVARLARSRLAACIVQSAKAHVQDVHVLRVDDTFHALVLTIQYGDGENPGVFEVLLTPSVQSDRPVESKALPYINRISVGAKFDKKEYVFRNYAGVHSLTGQVVLVVRYQTGKSAKVEYTLNSPSGKISKKSTMSFNPQWSISDTSIDFDHPTEPGVWTVMFKAITPKLDQLGSVSFVLYPKELDNGEEIVDVSGIEKAGLRGYVEVADGVPAVESLHRYVDSVTGMGWLLSDTCVMKQPSSGCDNVPLCTSSTWSTVYPDPKSDLTPIKQDGRIR